MIMSWISKVWKEMVNSLLIEAGYFSDWQGS